MEMNILVILMVAFALFAILMFILFYVYAKKYYNEKHLIEEYDDDAEDDIDILEKKNNLNIEENNEIVEKENETNSLTEEMDDNEFVPIKKK